MTFMTHLMQCNVNDTISWQGHHGRGMQLSWLYFLGTYYMSDINDMFVTSIPRGWHRWGTDDIHDAWMTAMTHEWHRWYNCGWHRRHIGDIDDIRYVTSCAFVHMCVWRPCMLVLQDAWPRDNVISFGGEDESDVDTECNEWTEQ